jgi:hypothetical protein
MLREEVQYDGVERVGCLVAHEEGNCRREADDVRWSGFEAADDCAKGGGVLLRRPVVRTAARDEAVAGAEVLPLRLPVAEVRVAAMGEDDGHARAVVDKVEVRE